MKQSLKLEIIKYLFFGAVSFVANFLTFAICDKIIHFNHLLANIIAWIVAVLIAYITNKKWVFISEKKGIMQMVTFFGGRIITLFIEELLLFIFISMLQCDTLIVKLISQVVVIVLNYLISKLFIFKKER